MPLGKLRTGVSLYHEVHGLALLGGGSEEKALESFREAVQRDPGREYPWLLRARLAHMLGLYPEADSSYTALASLNPTALEVLTEDAEMWAEAREGR